MSDRARNVPLGELPEGWAWATIDEVAEINPKADLDGFDPDLEVSFVRMAGVEEETGRLNPSDIRSLGDVAKGYTRFREGDVLFAKITPCMENGKIALAENLRNGMGFGSTEFHVLRPREGVESKYLLHFLLQPSFRGHAEHNMKGTAGQKRVPPDILRQFWIPIAPLSEQRRIVETIETQLSEIANGVESLDAVDGKLVAYRQSLLKAAVIGELTWDLRNARAQQTDGNRLAKELADQTSSVATKRLDSAQDRPEWLPSTWGWASVGQLCEPGRKLAYGVLQPGRDHPEGIPFVRVGDMDAGRVRRDSLKRIDPSIASRYPRTQLRGGEVLISLVGTIGRTAVADPSLEGGNTARAVGVIPASSKINPYWLEIWLRASINRAFLEQKAHEVARKTLNLEDVRRFGVAIPPREEQDVIVERTSADMDVANTLADEQQRTCSRAATLRRSILNSAFSGRLVAQDSNDEPAVELLARIRAERAKAPKISDRGGRPRKTSRTSKGATP